MSFFGIFEAEVADSTQAGGCGIDGADEPNQINGGVSSLSEKLQS